jgi:hypothetical protein
MPKVEYELKPCPFCSEDEGKQGVPRYYEESDGLYTDCHIVACGWCDVSRRGETQIEAINSWNRRNGRYD